MGSEHFRRNFPSTIDRDSVEASARRALLNHVGAKAWCPGPLRRFVFKAAGISSTDVCVEPGFRFENLNVKLGMHSHIGPGTVFLGIGHISVGPGVDVRERVLDTRKTGSRIESPLFLRLASDERGGDSFGANAR